MIDYKLLLEKYINHVGMIEGVSFIYTNKGMMGDEFSDEEHVELLKLDGQKLEGDE